MKYIVGLLMALSFATIGCISDNDCDPNTSMNMYHVKCYQMGSLILDTDVVCANHNGFGMWFYEEKSRSRIYIDTEKVQCFVLKKEQ